MAAEGNYIVDTDIDNWPDGYTEAQKLSVIQQVETLIEQLTKDYFYAKSFSITLNGNGKSQLFLGLIPDILSVTEIKLSEVALSTELFSFDENSIFRAALATAQCKAIEGITLSDTDPVSITITAHGFVSDETVRLVQMVGINPSLDGEYVVTKVNSSSFTLNDTDSSDYSGSFESGTACFATLAELHYLTDETSGIFPKGTKNIKVTGTYGWSSCPSGIKEVAMILCRYENDKTLYTPYSDLESEHLGDYSYSRKGKYLTGILEADRLLKNYIRNKPVLGVI